MKLLFLVTNFLCAHGYFSTVLLFHFPAAVHRDDHVHHLAIHYFVGFGNTTLFNISFISPVALSWSPCPSYY